MYAIKLDENSRILSATFERYKAPNDVLVETLPEGDITDYKYIDGEYVYDPRPIPPEPEPAPTAEDDLNAMAIDHEYRLTLLELGL